MKKNLLIAVLLCLCAGSQAADALKVYFIGNSLTMEAKPDRVQTLLIQKGVPTDYAAQLSGGKSLIRQMNYAKEPDQQWQTPSCFGGTASREGKFGTWDKAFKAYKWDAAVFQIFSSSLHDDLEALEAFIGICLENDSCKQFYIYSTWPSRPRPQGSDFALAEFDYSRTWEQKYTAGPESVDAGAKQNYATRSYVDALFAQLNKRYPELKDRIHLIPVGEVLFRIDQKIKAGELPEVFELARRTPDMVPGFRDGHSTEKDGMGVFYNDPIHFKQGLGTMVSSTTLATVLGGKNPDGLAGSHFGLNDSKDKDVLKAIQQIIRETVQNDPRTGVK